jgi:parallel beta-helix repeat protein
VVVDKPLTIISENGPDNCIVNASNGDLSGNYAFDISADYVNISGFTIENYTATTMGAIKTYPFSNHINISENIVRHNAIAICIYTSTEYCKVANNYLHNNSFYGILLYGDYHMIMGNQIEHCQRGMIINEDNNSIANNTIRHTLIGIDVSSGNYNIIEHNQFLEDNLGQGIRVISSHYNVIRSNIIENNSNGIEFQTASTNNTVHTNHITNNSYGIVFMASTMVDNIVYNNYLDNDNYNVYDLGNNQYNTTKTPGINIIGGPWLGGNYWSDYVGSDTDGDYLGDDFLPHNSSGEIKSGGDMHPLVYSSAPPPNSPPVADFTHAPLTPTTLDTIIFDDNSSDPDGHLINWTWDFDDGNFSYDQNPMHQYSLPGTYTVTLTVQDNDYEYDSLNRLITISLPEVEDIGIIDANISDGDTRYVGPDTLNATIKNLGTIATSVVVNLTLEWWNTTTSSWEEVDSGTNGPYDLDPDVWIESFFDVFYSYAGEYRATFSLDTPLYTGWTDHNPGNDIYHAIITVAPCPPPEDATEEVMETIEDMELDPYIEQLLEGHLNLTLKMLDKADAFRERGKDKQAEHMELVAQIHLEIFQILVDILRGVALTEQQADTLIEMTDPIIADLEG